jgi:hypothetical protein
MHTMVILMRLNREPPSRPVRVRRAAFRATRWVWTHVLRWVGLAALLVCAFSGRVATAGEQVIRYFPVGPIYDYRWKLLDLALDHARDLDESFRLQPYAEEITQNRAMSLLQSGDLEVIALGTNPEREAQLMPIRFDILRGMVGFRVFLIRGSDQARIARMNDTELRQRLTFGLQRDWADLPIMTANGYKVETSIDYANLFAMLDAGRFDAFPRGINEIAMDLASHHEAYPRLAMERTKALYFPFPIYFWVNKGNPALAQKIEHGLALSLKDGSFKRLFLTYHAEEIAAMRKYHRHVIRLANPNLPAGVSETDTTWWWDQK